MEKYLNRWCNYWKDKDELLAFWLDCRLAADIRVYPTLWRSRLLLTSRVWQPERDTQIWQDRHGQIAGFAMLWRSYPQSPYLVLAGYFHPAHTPTVLLGTSLDWGTQRAEEISAGAETPLTLFANGFSNFSSSKEILQTSGYQPVTPNPDEQNIYLSRPLNQDFEVKLPSGYSLTRLQSLQELDLYREVYSFADVSPLHQKEQLDSDEYHHLVIQNRAGELAAYCECSFSQLEWQKAHLRLGWIDYIETRPEEQRKGLGQAALYAGLVQLKRAGAETAVLVTVTSNSPAVNLYRKAGFEEVEVEEGTRYRKQIGENH